MAGRRNAVLAHGHAARARDLLGDFGAGQHAAVAWLGPLADFQLDHLDLIDCGGIRKTSRRKGAGGFGASEGSGAVFPDDVAAVLAVLGGQATLPRVVGEIAGPGTLIESPNGVWT